MTTKHPQGETIMKKKTFLTALTMLILSAALLIPVQSTQAASAKSKAITAYKKFLSQKTIPWGNDAYYTAVPAKNCSFSLIYIDNNSVPELVITNTQDITHIAGFGVIYTYRNGKMQLVQNTQLDGKFYYYKKKGIYASSYLSSGIVNYTYSKLSKGKATAKLSKQTNTNFGKTTTEYYKISSSKMTKLTKSKFNKSLKNLVGSKKRSTAKFYKNTKAKRTKYLK